MPGFCSGIEKNVVKALEENELIEAIQSFIEEKHNIEIFTWLCIHIYVLKSIFTLLKLRKCFAFKHTICVLIIMLNQWQQSVIAITQIKNGQNNGRPRLWIGYFVFRFLKNNELRRSPT
jgi:hypothetical protein